MLGKLYLKILKKSLLLKNLNNLLTIGTNLIVNAVFVIIKTKYLITFVSNYLI